MNLVYTGKTKDVYAMEDSCYLLKFKDDVTGENGVFDPGSNNVGLTIEGVGKSGLRLTKYFFEKLNETGIPTHYIDADLEKVTMTVKKATLFGEGLEVICRYRAVGSFLRRYEKYVADGQELDAFVEVTLKDDDRNDPPITQDALDMLGLLSKTEYEVLKNLTQKIGNIIKQELAKKGLELYDIKFEFGRIDEDQHIALIDEISGGNMRAYQNGRRVEPMELGKLML
jgi:phosphoribosylaminoimidazole-succinocarboxamide synthase